MNPQPEFRDQKPEISPALSTAQFLTVHCPLSAASLSTAPLPPAPSLSARRAELRRLISEANEIGHRWLGMAALLDRIERADTLEVFGGEREAVAMVHNAAQERWEETRLVVKRLWGVVTQIQAEEGQNHPGQNHGEQHVPGDDFARHDFAFHAPAAPELSRE